MPGPQFRNLGQNVDARAHVLAAFRVVRRCGIQSVRPPLLQKHVAIVKLLQPVEIFAAGIAADIVHRYEPVVVVERRVLHAFGHDASGELLPAHDEREPFVALRCEVFRRIDEQHPVEKNE